MCLRVSTDEKNSPPWHRCRILRPGGRSVSIGNLTPRRPAGPIRRLPDALVDQIAAGEVVERPASVVKELVENALDADARRIRVEVRGGGRDWIAVTDDGWGMGADDARLALSRHATSKIGAAEDLDRIHTYGFRGEALPAIASVSRLRLRTRPRGAPAAFELRVEVGQVIEESAVAGPEGTRVEVADLFAGVPARRKFLKKMPTEWGHVADWLARSALARPDVHFDIRRDDRPAWIWPAVSEPLDRVAAVISEDDAAAFVAVNHADTELALQGFVSRPDRHRGTLGGVYWFVNRRPVRDRLLQHALVEIYRDLLPRGRFPLAVLFLEIDPAAVDVNVHPAKWEVRFRDPQAIHRLVRRGVRAAIETRSWASPAAPQLPGAPGLSEGGGGLGDSVQPASESAPGPTSLPFLPEATPSLDATRPGEPVAASRVHFGELRLLGQVMATYLVVEARQGLLLVDQHAAHERVLYERLREQWLGRGVESQGLLVPASVPLDPTRFTTLTAAPQLAERLGFELEPFGADTVAVRSVPAILSGRDPALLVSDLADELAAAGMDAETPPDAARVPDSADRVFASLACHSARRKGDVLLPREQQALLDAVDAIPWAPTCPHGRPVFIPIDLAEIERRFGRR